jgi:hypothetical protein
MALGQGLVSPSSGRSDPPAGGRQNMPAVMRNVSRRPPATKHPQASTYAIAQPVPKVSAAFRARLERRLGVLFQCL